MLKINGVDITAPKSFQVDIEDVDGESGRNARGEMLRDRIAVKRKFLQLVIRIRKKVLLFPKHFMWAIEICLCFIKDYGKA